MYGVSERTHVCEGIYIPLMVRHELSPPPPPPPPPLLLPQYIIIFHCIILHIIGIIELVDSICRNDPSTPRGNTLQMLEYLVVVHF